jgi:hypothetical protein
MEKYFYATTIINKYGLLHTICIIYMGLLFFLLFIMMLCMNITNARIKYAMDKYRFTSRRGFGNFRSPKLDLQIFQSSNLPSSGDGASSGSSS